jgi:hypothetical protein
MTHFCIKSTYSIFDAIQGVRIPLSMKGVISVFDTHIPNLSEIEEIPRITLTSDDEWVHMQSEVELNKTNYPPVASMVCADTNPDTMMCLSSLLTDEPIEFFSDLEVHTNL